MPITTAPAASQRLLSLLSLLQVRRDWPGGVLRQRLQVSERTVRRDIDRLRELGYRVAATRGPDGGYRLDAGQQLPPLLFDDEQAVALALALRTTAGSGAGIDEAAGRALATLRQVMPTRLRARIDSVEVSAVVTTTNQLLRVDPQILVAIGAAIRAKEELRFDYDTPNQDLSCDVVRQVQPHHLVARDGRWYLIAWSPRRQGWRIYRADRITPRTPAGPRFQPRVLPGGDVADYLSARFKGSIGANEWPCSATVFLDLPAAEVAPFIADGTVESAGTHRCRVRLGSWSWVGLAASLAGFDTNIQVIDPPALRKAFADLAHRAQHAADGSQHDTAG